MVEHLEKVRESYGDITVYTYDGWFPPQDPVLAVAEGGSSTHPYPGLYLN